METTDRLFSTQEASKPIDKAFVFRRISKYFYIDLPTIVLALTRLRVRLIKKLTKMIV